MESNKMPGWKTVAAGLVGVVVVILIIVGLEMLHKREFIPNETATQIISALVGIVLLAILGLRSAISKLFEVNKSDNEEIKAKLVDLEAKVTGTTKPSGTFETPKKE